MNTIHTSTDKDKTPEISSQEKLEILSKLQINLHEILKQRKNKQ